MKRLRHSRYRRILPRGLGTELFQERRARASALPASYAQGFGQYLSYIIDADSDAQYFSFAVWTKAGWGADLTELSRMIRKACQFASCDLFPSLSRSSRNRIPLPRSILAVFLPAQKEHGVYHIHGFLRVPISAVTLGWTPMRVETKGKSGQVWAPRAVERFGAYLRTFAHGATTSLYVDHDGTR